MDPDLEGLSAGLRAFVSEAPRARTPHLAFLQRAAAILPEGSSILDVGAGRAPYREFFHHARYVTCDWENSIYDEVVDIRAPADAIPVHDDSFDAALCTQVLEHVSDPAAVLRELRRVIRPRGHLWITVPFVWYLHEEPYDYYRYTSHGLRYLLENAGFADIVVEPLSDSFTTLAQLVDDLGWLMGQSDDGHDQERAVVAQTMRKLGDLIGSFANYDTRWIMPIDFAVTAS